MIKKILCLSLSVLFIMLSLTACSGDGTGKQIVLPVDNEPQYLDPQIVSDRSARNIIANCFEGLVTYDENAGIVPAGCEKYDISSDGLTYTFYLRKDCNWLVTRAAKKIIGDDRMDDFDTAVTADDYVFALRRALAPETKSPYVSSLICIKNAQEVNHGDLKRSKLGVSAKDKYTLVIELSHQDSDFLYALTLPVCMPCNEEFFELTGGRYGLSAEYLIYNGPFYISNWSAGTAITAKKNTVYHVEAGSEAVSAEVLASSIYFSFNNEQSTRAGKVKDGTYDLAPITSSQAQLLSQNKKVTVRSFSSAVKSMIFNCSNEIVGEVNIRRAITEALDGDVILDFLNKDIALGTVPSACLACGISYRSAAKSVKAKSKSDERALKYLKNGLEQLDTKKIDLTILCETELENTVRMIMQKWQSLFGVALGISVEALDSVSLRDRIEAGDFEIAIYDVEYTEATAVNAVCRFCTDSRNNIVFLSDNKYDKLIEKLASASGDREINSIIEEAEAYLISKSIVYPICETEVYYAMANGVSGIVFSPTGDTVYLKTAVRK